MTKQTFAILAAFSLAAVSLMGQSSPQIRANVPFDFVVGSKTFPAGEYVVQTGLMPNSTWIRGTNSGAHAIFLSHPSTGWNAADEVSLKFHRYGDRYFLYQVFTLGDGVGQELPKSRAESQEIAARPASRGTVTLAAKR